MVSLIEFDIKLFLYLNSFHSDFWDIVMVYISAKATWIPLYLTVLFFFVKKFGIKNALILLLFFLTLIALSDQISGIFKHQFLRLRPCFEPKISTIVHCLKKPGGEYGFVSAHAANAFAFATFSALIFKTKIYTICIILWAAIVAYSRIYLGLHYPGDVICGAISGIIIAYLLNMILLKINNKYKILYKPINSTLK